MKNNEGTVTTHTTKTKEIAYEILRTISELKGEIKDHKNRKRIK